MVSDHRMVAAPFRWRHVGEKPGYKIGKRHECIFHEEEIQMPNKMFSITSHKEMQIEIQCGVTAYLIEQVK